MKMELLGLLTYGIKPSLAIRRKAIKQEFFIQGKELMKPTFNA